MTVTRTNGSNTGGYNVYIRKMTGAGAPTEVAGYDSAARTAGYCSDRGYRGRYDYLPSDRRRKVPIMRLP